MQEALFADYSISNLHSIPLVGTSVSGCDAHVTTTTDENPTATTAATTNKGKNKPLADLVQEIINIENKCLPNDRSVSGENNLTK